MQFLFRHSHHIVVDSEVLAETISAPKLILPRSLGLWRNPFLKLPAWKNFYGAQRPISIGDG